MNIKTKILMDSEYINILRDELQYSEIKVLNREVHKDYGLHFKSIKDYFYNQIVTIRYHLLADTEEIYMTIIKNGIHLNGTCDSKIITVFKDDLEELYSNYENNNTKKRKKKR